MAKTYNRTVKVFIDGTEVEGTIPVIQKRIRELTRDVKKMTIGTQEYNDKVKEIAQLNSILAEHKRAVRGVVEESQSLGKRLGNLADFFNKWYYSLQTGLDALGGATTKIRQSVNDYADMEESMADVRKYTGQTATQVREMNEDFKRLDTRTTRDQLNALAGSAGRLGITNKKAIEEFVDGADKIKGALKDDLGPGAVEKVGKLAQMFGEDKKKGLRGAMLATGSAVNDLAQSSSANAGYIVDFTADLSGVAIQAGMTQSQIMGLASALDQNMQEEATASTVFSQLITKMYQEPARFAALAGVDVKNFTNLLKTDANEALLRFLSAMKSTGGFEKMAPLFSEMKLEGTRAVGVLSSVATHLDQVREAQAVANDAYSKGTSILDEFDVQNSTVQAGIDKAKKQFHELSIELGEKLLPLVQHGITAGSLLVRVMKIIYQVGEFIAKHAVAISAVAASLMLYNGVLTLTIIKTKLYNAYLRVAIALDTAYRATMTLTRSAMVALHAVWALLTRGVQGYIVVMRAARLASLTNPWTALATVLSVVGVAIYSATKAWQAHKQAIHDNLQEVKEANAIKKQQAEIDKRVAESHIEEKTRIAQLNKIIHSNAFSINERRAAIAALQRIVPSYHAKIKNEGKLYEENANAIDDYIKKLNQAAMAQAINEQQVDIAREELALKLKERKIRFSIKSVNAEIEAHPEVYKEYKYHSGGRTTRGVSAALAQKERERGIHEGRLNANLSQQRVLAARKRALDKTVNGDKELRSALASVVTDGGSESLGKNNDNKPGHYVSSSHKSTKPDPEVERQKLVQKKLDSITVEYENKRTQAKQAYLDGSLATQEDYNRKVEDLELEELNKKLEVADLEPKKRAEIEKKILDYKVKLYDQLHEIEQSFGDTEAEQLAHELDTIKQKYDHDLALLENLHDKKIISEEVYQADLKKLKERFTAETDKANKESNSRLISDAKTTFDELMESQRKTNVKAGYLDEQSQENRSKAWQGYLQKLLDGTKLTAEQRQAIQQEIDNTELEQTEASLKRKQELTQKYNDIICEAIVSAGQQLGEQMSKVLQGERAQFKDFLRGILSLIIDALEKTILAARAASIAKNVSTLGAAGLAKAAVETALITAAFEMAKAAVGSFDTGGFTPAGPWDKPQGIVHSNEFVANRFATANPNVMPVLNLINEAQRSGSVSRLSSEDIAAVVPGSSQFVPRRAVAGQKAVAATAAPDTSAVTTVLSRIVRSLNNIDKRFSTPIVAETYATGKHGTIEAERLVNKMKSNVSRQRK
jgi:TP901 family phage tail tape measure protein